MKLFRKKLMDSWNFMFQECFKNSANTDTQSKNYLAVGVQHLEFYIHTYSNHYVTMGVQHLEFSKH